MKKVILSIALLISLATPVHAEQPQTIAVIDSGVVTSQFPNIITEVCVLEYSMCPNGKGQM